MTSTFQERRVSLPPFGELNTMKHDRTTSQDKMKISNVVNDMESLNGASLSKTFEKFVQTLKTPGSSNSAQTETQQQPHMANSNGFPSLPPLAMMSCSATTSRVASTPAMTPSTSDTPPLIPSVIRMKSTQPLEAHNYRGSSTDLREAKEDRCAMELSEYPLKLFSSMQIQKQLETSHNDKRPFSPSQHTHSARPLSPNSAIYSILASSAAFQALPAVSISRSASSELEAQQPSFVNSPLLYSTSSHNNASTHNNNYKPPSNNNDHVAHIHSNHNSNNNKNEESKSFVCQWTEGDMLSSRMCGELFSTRTGLATHCSSHLNSYNVNSNKKQKSLLGNALCKYLTAYH